MCSPARVTQYGSRLKGLHPNKEKKRKDVHIQAQLVNNKISLGVNIKEGPHDSLKL